MTSPIQNKPNDNVALLNDQYKAPVTPPAQGPVIAPPPGWAPPAGSVPANTPHGGNSNFVDGRVNALVQGSSTILTNALHLPAGAMEPFQAALKQLGPQSQRIDPSIFKSLTPPGFESKLPELLTQGLSALTQLNLSPQDIAGAGAALPDLIKAGVAYASGDQKGAAMSLLDAAYKDPQLAEKLAPIAAKLIPNSNDPGTRLAKELLSDPAAVKDLVSHPNLRGAFDKLLSKPPDMQGALEILSKDPQAVGDLANVLAKDPQFGPVMKQFGLTPQNLKNGAAALPDLYRAYQDMQKGDTRDAFASILDAGKKSPQLAESILTAFGKNMKPGSPGYNPYEKAILSDPKCVHDLVTDPKAGDAAEKLLSGDTAGAALEIAQDPTAAQHFAAALSGQTGLDQSAWGPIFQGIAAGVSTGEQTVNTVTNAAKQVFNWLGF